MDGYIPIGALAGLVPLNGASPMGPTGCVYPLMGNLVDSSEEYLKSLDSDTRAYVLNHVGEDSSMDEMKSVVAELRG